MATFLNQGDDCMTKGGLPKAIEWRKGELLILDQTRLPHEVVIESVTGFEALIDCIKTLKIRGAPAIGIAAAYGMVLGLASSNHISQLQQEFSRRANRLKAARPTAVNLSWAVQRMLDCLQKQHAQNQRSKNDTHEAGPSDIIKLLVEEAIKIHQEDSELCRRIGQQGLALVEKYPNILTHCNAGAFAVSQMGTALAPIYLAKEKGIEVHVYVGETRPLLQGARLTAYELREMGVPMTLITDSMAATVMQTGRVDMVLVGADRIAANGDVANKIGTLGLAVLCQHFNIPFYVAVPWSTLDLSIDSGADIVIEERSDEEITHIRDQPIAPAGVKVFNPAFDITPSALVTGLITDKGVLSPGEIIEYRQRS